MQEIVDDNARTVTVEVHGAKTHTFDVCPACPVDGRDRFERVIPEPGDDSGSIVA